MGIKQNILSGRIIGHHVRYLSKQISERSGGITITKRHKVGAFLTIQVDDTKIHYVPCRASDLPLKDGHEVTMDMCREVYNHLTDVHPFDTEVEFVEIVTPRKGGVLRRYELRDEQG